MMFFLRKVIRDSQTAIIKIGERVWKLPLSFSACKEMLREKKKLPEVGRDEHFSKFLVKGFFCGGVILSNPYLKPATKEDIGIIKKYFSDAFKFSLDWDREKLMHVIEDKFFLKFIFESIPNDTRYWLQYLDENSISKSSSHGDFHLNNILLEDNRLFFIDWIRYNNFSSRYFDLIDFYIFYNKNEVESWTDFWMDKFKKNRGEIFGIKIERKYFPAYAIWKVSVELKTLYLRGKLSEQKRNKYIIFLNKLRETI